MAGTVRAGGHGHMPHFTLNSDGQQHRVMNALTVFILVVGFVALGFGIAIIGSAHAGLALALPAGVAGLVALLGGLYAQMMSVTREQRILIISGIVVGFIGLAMGLSHGAFG